MEELLSINGLSTYGKGPASPWTFNKLNAADG